MMMRLTIVAASTVKKAFTVQWLVLFAFSEMIAALELA
jgi:hypothetical protein